MGKLLGRWVVISVAPWLALGTGCSAKDDGAEPATGQAKQAVSRGVGQVVFAQSSTLLPGVYLAKGTDGFGVSSVIPSIEFGDRVALADVDNDNLDEIVVARPAGAIRVYEQDGTPVPFSAPVSFIPPQSELHAGDLDNDGFDELVIGLREMSDDGAIHVIARPGHSVGDIFDNGGFDYDTFRGGHDLAVCDLDGDGFDEIVTAPNWQIYSNPTRPVIDVSSYFGGTLPLFDPYDRIACADFNGDRVDDLVVVHQYFPLLDHEEADLSFFTLPGKGPIVYAPAGPEPLFQRGDVITAGDLTSDGIAEIVIGHVRKNRTPPSPTLGFLAAYDNQGTNITNDVFGAGAFPTFGSGDHVAIRRRNGNLLNDTDGDGLPDLWEGQGPNDGVDVDGDGIGDFKLPGANPFRKDLYVEFDAMDCGLPGSDCPPMDAHHHMPTAADLAAVVAAFANAPVKNACRSTGVCEPDGIALHIEFGEQVPHVNSCDFNVDDPATGPFTPPCYSRIRRDFFGTPAERGAGAKVVAAKALAYRYALWAHDQPGAGGKGLQGDILLSLFSEGGVAQPNGPLHIIQQVFMHEFGHALGLGHGGRSVAGEWDNMNRKPNYLSVMNYTQALNRAPLGLLDYSRKALPDLIETNLSEPLGISEPTPPSDTMWRCPGTPPRVAAGKFGPAAGPLDWNCNNSAVDVGVQADLNGDRYCIVAADGQPLRSATHANDVLMGGTIRPGPNGVLDTVMAGGGTDDVPVARGAVGVRVEPGSNGLLETVPAGDDIVTDQWIIDGPDRVCDSTFVAGDVEARGLGSGQPSLLAGREDWQVIQYKIEQATEGEKAALKHEPTPEDFREAARASTQADLEVQVAPAFGSVIKGSPAAFHVGVSNLGPESANGALIRVALPGSVHFSACTSPGGTCVISGGVGSIYLDTLAAGATITGEFSVQTDCSTTAGSIELTASASSESQDVQAANNHDSASVAVTAAGPVFRSVPADITTSVCVGVALGTPVADDSCGGSVTITNNAPNTFPVGRTVVTWTATNAAGSVTATQAVTAALGDSASCCPAGSRVVQGTPSNDTLNGLSGVDCILGLGGQDTINGNGGNDLISGGSGNDTIRGNDGNDRIYGGTGQDQLFGDNGDDQLEGNDGDDVCRGGIGADLLGGGQGQDQLLGEDGNDTLRGDGGSDTLNGGSGNDTLEGNSGVDSCTGGVGTNTYASCETRPDAPGAPEACSDGVQDGSETAVDCGGSGCRGCTGGAACVSGGDCLSQTCTANACVAPASNLIGSLSITSDWGGGYCANIEALNIGTASTVSWAATLDARGTSIYQTTKATFSGASGIVSVTPQTAQLAIAPGAANSQVSFCANRPAGNTTVLPTLVGTTVTY